MAWTVELKEKRVADAEAEYERAVKARDAYATQKKELETKLEALTPEELAKREARVAKAKKELDWRLAAPTDED